MLKKILSFISIGLILNVFCFSIVNAKNLEKETDFAVQVKTAVAKLGTGSKARVKVKLRDKTKLKGYVSEANENSFVLIEDNTNTSKRIAYSGVKQVKGRNNLTGDQILIGIGVAVVIGILVFALSGED